MLIYMSEKKLVSGAAKWGRQENIEENVISVWIGPLPRPLAHSFLPQSGHCRGCPLTCGNVVWVFSIPTFSGRLSFAIRVFFAWTIKTIFGSHIVWIFVPIALTTAETRHYGKNISQKDNNRAETVGQFFREKCINNFAPLFPSFKFQMEGASTGDKNPAQEKQHKPSRGKGEPVSTLKWMYSLLSFRWLIDWLIDRLIDCFFVCTLQADVLVDQPNYDEKHHKTNEQKKAEKKAEHEANRPAHDHNKQGAHSKNHNDDVWRT